MLAINHHKAIFFKQPTNWNGSAIGDGRKTIMERLIEPANQSQLLVPGEGDNYQAASGFQNTATFSQHNRELEKRLSKVLDE